MSKKKLLIGLGVTLLILSVVVVIFSFPSRVSARDPIEYVICGLDSGAPVMDGFILSRDNLKNMFGEWQDEWGFVATCDVKFQKKTSIFNKLTKCYTVYEDLEDDGKF